VVKAGKKKKKKEQVLLGFLFLLLDHKNRKGNRRFTKTATATTKRSQEKRTIKKALQLNQGTCQGHRPPSTTPDCPLPLLMLHFPSFHWEEGRNLD